MRIAHQIDITCLSFLLSAVLLAIPSQSCQRHCMPGETQQCFCPNGLTGAQRCLGEEGWDKCICEGRRPRNASPAAADHHERPDQSPSESQPTSGSLNSELEQALKEDIEDTWKQLQRFPDNPRALCKYARLLKEAQKPCQAFDIYQIITTELKENTTCREQAESFLENNKACKDNTDDERTQMLAELQKAKETRSENHSAIENVWNELLSDPTNPERYCDYINQLQTSQASPCLGYDISTIAFQYSILEKLDENCRTFAERYLHMNTEFCENRDTETRNANNQALKKAIEQSKKKGTKTNNTGTTRTYNSTTTTVTRNGQTIKYVETGNTNDALPGVYDLGNALERQRQQQEALMAQTESDFEKLIAKLTPLEQINEAMRNKNYSSCLQIAKKNPQNADIQCSAAKCLASDRSSSNFCEIYSLYSNALSNGGGSCKSNANSFIQAHQECNRNKTSNNRNLNRVINNNRSPYNR